MKTIARCQAPAMAKELIKPIKVNDYPRTTDELLDGYAEKYPLEIVKRGSNNKSPSNKTINTKNRSVEKEEVEIIKTIGRSFIEESMKVYPVLETDKALRRMYCYLSVQHSKLEKKGHKKEEGIVVPARVLEKIEGTNKKKHFIARDFIERFSEEVFPLEVKQYKSQKGETYEHSYRKGIARRVLIVNNRQYDRLLDLIKVGDERVYIDTLKELRRDRVGKYKTKDKTPIKSNSQEGVLLSETQELIAKSDRLQEELLGLLNGLPTHRFTKVVKNNLPRVEALIKNIENKHLANYVDQLLDELVISPQPTYKASDKALTSRIFTSNSYLNLPRDMRDMFLEDCIKVDIKSSQFSIIANLWGIQSIVDFLDSGKSLWEELFNWLGLENESKSNKAVIKDAMKRFTYSSIYGMGKGKAQFKFRSEVLEVIPSLVLNKFYPSGKRHSLGIYLSQHPFFVELFKKREIYINKIKKDKGILCPDGKWLSLEGTTPQSLLACMAQRAEMIAMEPLTEIMKAEYKKSLIHKDRTNKFLCMGWLHDGVYIKTPKKEIPMWLGRLEVKSSRLKQSTGLSYDISPPFGSVSTSKSNTKTYLHSDGHFHSKPQSETSIPFVGRNQRTQAIYSLSNQ